MADYDNNYAEQLLNGMRLDGKTDVECCLEWGILYTEYKEWVREIPAFAIAHEVGEMQYSAYWHNLAKGLAEKGNATVLVAGMRNLNVKNWVDKRETVEEQEQPITAIEISILPPYEEKEDENSED